jgi:hypothetical protein
MDPAYEGWMIDIAKIEMDPIQNIMSLIDPQAKRRSNHQPKDGKKND